MRSIPPCPSLVLPIISLILFPGQSWTNIQTLYALALYKTMEPFYMKSGCMVNSYVFCMTRVILFEHCLKKSPFQSLQPPTLASGNASPYSITVHIPPQNTSTALAPHIFFCIFARYRYTLASEQYRYSAT